MLHQDAFNHTSNQSSISVNPIQCLFARACQHVCCRQPFSGNCSTIRAIYQNQNSLGTDHLNFWGGPGLFLVRPSFFSSTGKTGYFFQKVERQDIFFFWTK